MENKKTNTLTLKHKIGYSLGDAGGCMIFTLMGSIFPVYCTDALGIDNVLLGILLAIWNIWDFINDPLMGALMDKSFAKNKNPKGKFRPWLLRSAPLLFVTSIALWSVPQFFEGITLICCLFLFKILYEASYTMFNIPMGALLSSMAGNDAERASLSSARGIGSGIGYALPAFVFPLIVSIWGDKDPTGYAIGSIIFAIIGFVLCLLHYKWTEERFNPTETTVESENIKLTDIFQVFKVNRPFLALCIHGLFICLMQSAATTINTYFYTDVLGDVAWSSYAGMISAPFMIVIFIFGSKVAKKLGLEKMIRYSLLISSVLYISLFIFQLFIPVGPIVYVIWNGIAFGMANVSIYLQWGLVGDAIEHNEKITGKRTEGSIYGTFNLSRRVGQTIALSGAMFALDLFGYNAELPSQTPQTIDGIKILAVLLPGILVLGSWAAFKFIWNLKPKKEKEQES